MKRLMLDIGGGKFKRGEEYTSVDKTGGDVEAEMWSLPFADGEAFAIWSSHTLEHAPMSKVPETLKEWHRVLRPGGRLILQVPNFDYVARYWLTGGDRAWAEKLVFGEQTADGEYHKCAFTPGIVRADLEGAGFKVLRVELRNTHCQETIQAVAIKPAQEAS